MKLMGLLAGLAISFSAGAMEREYIYGAELMSAKEREQYRQGFGKAPSEEARGQFRQRHRERLRERARQRGVELDEQSGIIKKAVKE